MFLEHKKVGMNGLFQETKNSFYGILKNNGAFELYIDTISKGNVEQSIVKCDFLAQYDDIACVHGSYVDSKDNYYLWINMVGNNSSCFILQIVGITHQFEHYRRKRFFLLHWPD